MKDAQDAQDTQNTQDSVDEMKVIREVNTQADALYEVAKQLGDQAAEAFGEKHRAQITGLENIAESALKTSDIFDYIKRQTARHDHWRQGGFGSQLLNTLEKEIATKRDAICSGGNLNISNKTDAGRQERRRIYLLLMRQFIRQMAVEYEFQVSLGKGARRNGTHN